MQIFYKLSEPCFELGGQNSFIFLILKALCYYLSNVTCIWDICIIFKSIFSIKGYEGVVARIKKQTRRGWRLSPNVCEAQVYENV